MDDDLIKRGDVRAKMVGSYLSHQALNAIPAVRVGVRALEWECTDWSAGDGVKGENDCEWQSVSCGLQYIIDWNGKGMFTVTKPDDLCIYAGSLSAAKSAAQADYDARIRSALIVQPAPVQAPDVAALVEALREISDRHIPDQPAAFGGDELEWAVRQHRALRAIARAALAALEGRQ